MKAYILMTVLSIITPVKAGSTPTILYLKNCNIIKQRSMTQPEVSAYQQLQQAEQRMNFLQEPLNEMQFKLEPRQEQMQQLSVKIAAQAQSGHVDDLLVQAQQQTAEELSGTVAIYQKDIDLVTEFSKEIEKISRKFNELIEKDLAKDSFDQVKIVQQGETNTRCDQGIFFNKSLGL